MGAAETSVIGIVGAAQGELASVGGVCGALNRDEMTIASHWVCDRRTGTSAKEVRERGLVAGVRFHPVKGHPLQGVRS